MLTVTGSIPRDAGVGISSGTPASSLPRSALPSSVAVPALVGSALAPKDCDSIAITATVQVSTGNNEGVRLINRLNTCTFTANGLTPGNWNLTGSVIPKTTPASPAVVISPATVFVIQANGVLAGKAIYDFASAKWKLVQTP